MNLILFDDKNRTGLLPLSFTRPVSELRIGILKIREKWEKILGSGSSIATEPYLAEKFPLKIERDNLCILGGLLPDEKNIQLITQLEVGQALFSGNRLLAYRAGEKETMNLTGKGESSPHKVLSIEDPAIIDHPWQIFSKNGEQIEFDFSLLTANRRSAELPGSNKILGNNLFVEEGVRAECSIINTETGPVYLGKGSELMEGSIIRGPFAICEGSTIKMGAKIYGPTTIGPYSKAGGEINNSVIQGFSNKGHDGFLGNSVIGEWCNLGADTNNSNLKNNYADVKIWSYPSERFVQTGLQFCGLIMGDHSKCGINTMFNTGTVVGVNANIFGSGFPRNFIPSFSWGGAQGMTVFSLPKAYEVAEKVMQRRNVIFDGKEKKILDEVFKLTEKYRKNF